LIAQGYGSTETTPSNEKLSFKDTAVLSFEFCMLWFLANYFSSACLEHTSVASVTILTSTSSVWTLIFCSLFGIERFSTAKIMGVAASLAGVILISTVDLAEQADENRGSFPHKSSTQIALGDAMALLSAVIYGLYVTVMKRKVPNEDKVDMQMFFGLVGVFNVVLLWPLFFILHWTGIEPFELPPSSTIWGIIIFNAVSSFISDISWALALLMTTPLVVTVGLSLTIPLSLIGEILQYQQYSSFTYWVGAAVVFVSFIVVSRESHDEEDLRKDDDLERSVGVEQVYES
jgi:solute carrier family 35 protein F5